MIKLGDFRSANEIQICSRFLIRRPRVTNNRVRSDRGSLIKRLREMKHY